MNNTNDFILCENNKKYYSYKRNNNSLDEIEGNIYEYNNNWKSTYYEYNGKSYKYNGDQFFINNEEEKVEEEKVVNISNFNYILHKNTSDIMKRIDFTNTSISLKNDFTNYLYIETSKNFMDCFKNALEFKNNSREEYMYKFLENYQFEKSFLINKINFDVLFPTDLGISPIKEKIYSKRRSAATMCYCFIILVIIGFLIGALFYGINKFSS